MPPPSDLFSPSIPASWIRNPAILRERGRRIRFVYRLTPERKQILAENGGANGKRAFSEARCTPVIAEALDSETRLNRKR